MTQASAPVTQAGHSAPRPEQRFSLRETGRILEVPGARLKSLARAGLLAPQHGPAGSLSFGFRDLLVLRTTKGLLDSGVPMRRIRSAWTSLRHQLADDVPLTSITIRADGNRVVASDGRSAWRPDSGQVLLDFEAANTPEGSDALRPVRATAPYPAPSDQDLPAVRALPRTEEPTAEQLYDRALSLEDSSPAEAIEAYQRVLEADPYLADAHVNLGRLYQLTRELGRAEAHYRDAVRLAPDDPVPHFNLGVLLEEAGRREEAALAYAQAVARDAEFADAHCNLGLLLESMGRRQEAMRHLMAARELSRPAE
jgi:hypothetical protein